MAITPNALKAHLSQQIRTVPPAEWAEFIIRWIAFNAMYGGETKLSERANILSAIRRFISKQSAKRVLVSVEDSIDYIVKLPPGDMRLDQSDPKFRTVTLKYKRMYANRNDGPVNRLAAAAAILYQVRNNLIHGSKNPGNSRDIMLVKVSVQALDVILPALEAGVAAR